VCVCVCVCVLCKVTRYSGWQPASLWELNRAIRDHTVLPVIPAFTPAILSWYAI